jgi:hypothetical protein
MASRYEDQDTHLFRFGTVKLFGRISGSLWRSMSGRRATSEHAAGRRQHKELRSRCQLHHKCGSLHHVNGGFGPDALSEIDVSLTCGGDPDTEPERGGNFGKSGLCFRFRFRLCMAAALGCC